jgi:hypothetical protein
VIPLAPRYDDRIIDLLRKLDDRREPMAEVCRRVGAAAERDGLFRPSYSHLRRFIHAKRARDDDLRELRQDVAYRMLVGLRVNAYDIASRFDEAGRPPGS